MSRQALLRSPARVSALTVSVGSYGVTAAVAVVTFWLAYDGGTFDLASRNTVAIAAWWTLAAGIVLRLWPLASPPRAAVAIAAVLGAFGLLTLASARWGDSAERAVSEFDRVLLYLAIFLIAVVAAKHGDAARWANGIAVAIAATAVVALASRCYPELFGAQRGFEFLPSARNRLSFPLDYWNGLAIFVALALPLVLHGAVVSDRRTMRAAWVAPIPAIAAVIYLTSSRGGVGTALVGAAVFVALTSRRLLALVALTIAAIGASAAILVLQSRPHLVNQPGTAIAADEGRTAGVLIALICLGTGAASALAARWLPENFRVGARTTRAGLLAAAILVFVALIAADPVERFREFKRAPPELMGLMASEEARKNPTQQHLLSGTGTGRWQEWSAAVDAFETRPLLGRGAGSYEAWWAQHGTLRTFVTDAHSLYLETLAELGAIGLALVVVIFGTGLAVAVARLRRLAGRERVAAASLAGALAGYTAAAGIDWMWEMTAVSAVGVTILGLVTGPATLSHRTASPGWQNRRRLAAAAAVLVVAAAAIYGEAAPLLADMRLRESQEAVARGDRQTAFQRAADARALEPWASSPYLQLALVSEQAGDLEGADRWIAEAIERDPSDWRLWLVSGRISTLKGSVDEAFRSLRTAARLNPRSPLFAELRQALQAR